MQFPSRYCGHLKKTNLGSSSFFFLFNSAICACGQWGNSRDVEDRIFGGSIAKSHSIPYQVIKFPFYIN